MKPMTAREVGKMLKAGASLDEVSAELERRKPVEVKEYESLRRSVLRRFTSVESDKSLNKLSCDRDLNEKYKVEQRNWTLERVFNHMQSKFPGEISYAESLTDEGLLQRIWKDIDNACSAMSLVVENLVEDSSEFDHHFDYSRVFVNVLEHLLSATVSDLEMSMREASDLKVKEQVSWQEYEKYLEEGILSEPNVCPLCSAEYVNLKSVKSSGRCDSCSGKIKFQ